MQLVALGGIEKKLGLNVQAFFGAFRLLLGGSTIVQLPLAKYEIYLTFSKSTSVFVITFLNQVILLFLHLRKLLYP